MVDPRKQIGKQEDWERKDGKEEKEWVERETSGTRDEHESQKGGKVEDEL